MISIRFNRIAESQVFIHIYVFDGKMWKLNFGFFDSFGEFTLYRFGSSVLLVAFSFSFFKKSFPTFLFWSRKKVHLHTCQLTHTHSQSALNSMNSKNRFLYFFFTDYYMLLTLLKNYMWKWKSTEHFPTDKNWAYKHVKTTMSSQMFYFNRTVDTDFALSHWIFR